MMEVCDRWPPSSSATTRGDGDDIDGNALDERIANLDFEQSIDEQSLFSSLADATLISTDSLDLGALRARCETNKADYKLTFEDSGQWTTSGFGTATSGGGATHDEAPRNADYFLNNAHPTTLTAAGNDEDDDGIGLVPSGALTTWTRIRSAEPYDAKISSMPPGDVALRPSTTATAAAANERVRRPTSLLANFVERQSLGHSPDPPRAAIVEERAAAVGDFDENENEIGFVAPPPPPPPVATRLQAAAASKSTSHDARRPPLAPPSAASSPAVSTPTAAASVVGADRWRVAHRAPQRTPRRTFAELGVAGAAPDLNFLALPFSMPNFCRSSPSLDELLKHTQRNTQSGGRLSASKTEQLLSGCLESSTPRLPTSTSLIEDDPDSGVSCGGASCDGPAHIQDWASLSVLLPRHVVDACSFFKANVGLLSGSSAQSSGVSSGGGGGGGGAHRRQPVRVACSEPSESVFAPEGVATTTATSPASPQPPSSLIASLCAERPARLRATELRVLGLPTYEAKRRLVERVVTNAAAMARGSPTADVCAALTAVLGDGLRSKSSLWTAIVALTSPGPATQATYDCVQRLARATEKADYSRVQLFLKQLLKEARSPVEASACILSSLTTPLALIS